MTGHVQAALESAAVLAVCSGWR